MEKRNINDYPPHMQVDEQRRNDNIDAGNILCERCDGTGNEFYSMYCKCLACNGTGIAPKGV